MFAELYPEDLFHTSRSGRSERSERLGEDGPRDDAAPLEEIGNLKKNSKISTGK